MKHILYTMLLGVQLFSLPLVHAFLELSCDTAPQSMSLASTILESDGRLQSLLPFRVREHAIVRTCRRQLHSAHETAMRIARVLTNLYNLGTMMEQNPNLIRARTTSSVNNSKYYTDEELRLMSIAASGNRATASQVYHAALGRDNALDDILTGFVTRSSTGIDTRRVSTVSTLENQRSAQPERGHNSSIQTTPESMRTMVKTTLIPDFSTQSTRERSVDWSKIDACTFPEAVRAHGADSFESPLSLRPLEGLVNVPEAPNTNGLQLSTSASPIVEGCAREVARQAEASSRIPKRRSTGGTKGKKHQIAVEQESLATSVETSTPTRGNRLQRRLKTPQT